ncbi:MAG: M20/M25/M40 family metallo-hydrolase [Chloroflexi bacterium]|nr:M20/M25/M40 family metallo-hydrolase [Chloroflexota bacterium]
MSELLQRINEAVESRREVIVETLREWVRIPTQTPPGENYTELVNHIVPRFAAIGFDARSAEIPPEVFEQRSRVHYPELVGPRPNVLAKRDRSGKPRALWYCHLDTVPVGDATKWSVPPFEAVVKDGKVWGRGTADSKGGASSILSAFETLHAMGIEPEVSPVVALTTDEEIGPYTGLMYFADQGEFEGCQYFHSADGTAASVGISNNGAFTWTVRVRGKSVHSSLSPLGNNPIENSFVLLDEILKLKREVQSRLSKVPAPEEVVAKGGGTHLQALLNANIVRSGIKHNVVPNELFLEGDRRILPEEDEESAMAELREAVERARQRNPDLDAELRIRPFYTSYALSLDDPFAIRVKRVAEAVTGRTYPITGSNGSSDVAHVVRVTGIPCAKIGVNRPGETNNHGVDENVRIEDVLNCVKIICALATNAVA